MPDLSLRELCPNYSSARGYWMEITVRRCPRCGETKDLSLFTRDRTKKSGYHGLCKACNYTRLKDKLGTDHYRKYRKDWELLHRYNLTSAEYQAMLETQDGCCAICGSPNDKLVVDHDHATLQVRALLCIACNGLLGLANDDPARLAKAIEYLETYRHLDSDVEVR
jgi:hypothetical protein